MDKQKLFDLMIQEHGVTLLDSEMIEIINLCNEELKAEIASLKAQLAERE